MFEIVCEHCRSRYLLPQQVRDALRGQLLTCAVCTREWTGIPADPRSMTAGAVGLGPSRLPLHPYLQSNPYGDLGRALPTESAAARSTTQAVRVATARPSLRVAASGPGLELDAVFELGPHSFLIGGHDCHLELFHARALPDRAIRIRSVEGGFELEGLNGFLIPLGPISVAAGRIDSGARLDLVIDAYRVTLEASRLPGGPIRDLDAGAASPAPVAPPPPRAPEPAAPRPAAPPPPVADMSETVRGLGALGFDTRRFANPLDELDVGLLGLDPPVQGETFWLKKSPTLIGRTSGDILIADARVSGKHAQIDVLGLDQCAIKDLASTNGTTVNERPASTTRIKDGDVIGFGGVRLRFVVRAKAKRA